MQLCASINTKWVSLSCDSPQEQEFDWTTCTQPQHTNWPWSRFVFIQIRGKLLHLEYAMKQPRPRVTTSEAEVEYQTKTHRHRQGQGRVRRAASASLWRRWQRELSSLLCYFSSAKTYSCYCYAAIAIALLLLLLLLLCCNRMLLLLLMNCVWRIITLLLDHFIFSRAYNSVIEVSSKTYYTYLYMNTRKSTLQLQSLTNTKCYQARFQLIWVDSCPHMT